MPPKEQPTLYSVPKTTVWFAIVSLVLLGSLVWVVYSDYAREWKAWQRKFIQLKVEKAKAELAAVDKKVDQKKLEELEKQHSEALRIFQEHKGEYAKLEKEIARLDMEIGKVRDRGQTLKQFQDSARYFFEKYRAHGDSRAAEYQQKLDSLAPQIEKAKLDQESHEARRDEKQKALDELSAKVRGTQKDIDLALAEKTRIEKKLANVQPTLAKEILNAPMIDFIAPSLRIQQVVLEDLYDDYHFAKVQKVDRCTTCHLGIDQKGFENAPQPFKTHPNPDLFLSPASPHPLEKVGCTVCHGGNGHSVSFIESAHTPRNEEQAKEWEKKYRWHRMEKWENRILPLNHTEASCTKCHKNVVEVPQADKLNKGRKLAETYGCFGCHKVEGFENRWKVGPSLLDVRSKLDKDWITRWLESPKSFRDSTKMPQFFHLENTDSSQDREMSDAAIEGIVAYLAKNSGEVALEKPPVEGNIEHGQKLVKEIGCLGCHTAEGVSVNYFGPELSGMGSKVRADWLYTWLKDPKHYSPSTRMPNLRLSEQEAVDIAAYLLSQHNETFEKQPLPSVKPEVVDKMVMMHLQKNLRHEEARAELAKMSPEAKLEFLGKQSISHQGCFACHDIKGFEDTKPIGTELSDHGRKDVYTLDFGLVHVDHTREAWFFQKLKKPRIFDEGKEKLYYEKLRMPHFGFTDEQAESLVTFLLSLNQEVIPLEMQRRLNLKEEQIETGRLLVSKFNCQGCHTLDGKEGLIRSTFTDLGGAPPILEGEGAKVQEKWLDGFLKQPSAIRPWLTYRMPTFSFDDEQASHLVQYFVNLAHQEVNYKGLVLPETTPQKLEDGKLLFEKFQCVKCHKVDRTSMAMGASFLAPDLTLTKERLKTDWVVNWLKDPQAMQEGTMMPGFFPDGQSPLPDVLGGDVLQQMEAIRDYLYRYAPQPAQNPEPPKPEIPAIVKE